MVRLSKAPQLHGRWFNNGHKPQCARRTTHVIGLVGRQLRRPLRHAERDFQHGWVGRHQPGKRACLEVRAFRAD